MRSRSLAAGAVAAVALSASGLRAQIVLDADRAERPWTTVGPNGTYEGRPALVIHDALEVTGQSVRVEGPNGSRCDLVVGPGGHLRVDDALVELRGDLKLEEGGRLCLSRLRFSLLCSRPREFICWLRGGHFETRNVSIGGQLDENNAIQPSLFNLDAGHWLAYDTVIRDHYGLLMGASSRGPGQRGGTLIADGLFAGRRSDAVILSDRGDVTLKNSAIFVKLVLDASRAASVDLDLSIGAPIDRVYGDRDVHDGTFRRPVTKHIPGSPWRLELDNTIVPSWFVSLNGVTTNGPRYTLTMRDADSVHMRVNAVDLQGSPTLTGPWRRFYPEPLRLPELPASTPPGEHGIPPGCGVRIGNAEIRSSADSWSYSRTWSFGLNGAGTDFTVRGATRLSELTLSDARVTLLGLGAYELGLASISVDMDGRSHLTVRNATIGLPFGLQPDMIARAHSVCDLEDVVTENLLLHTTTGRPGGRYAGVDNARITLRRFVEIGRLTQRPSPGSTITVERSAPDEDFDLANLDFERGVQPNGVPRHWAARSVSGYQSSETSPLGRGSASFGYQSGGLSGHIEKTLRVRPGFSVGLSAWVKVLRRPPGATFELSVRGDGSGGRVVAARPLAPLGSWAFVHLDPFTVGADDTSMTLRFAHRDARGPVEVLLDELTFDAVRWWEADNLANLDFEDLSYPELGDQSTGPHNWSAWRVDASAEEIDVRPGARSGSRATRLRVESGSLLWKSLRNLVPGQTVDVTGWIKGLPHANGPYMLRCTVSEENLCWWDTSYGNNLDVLFVSGAWTPIRLTYTVPAPPLKEFSTRIAISRAPHGAELLVDDFQVRIR